MKKNKKARKQQNTIRKHSIEMKHSIHLHQQYAKQ